MPWKVIGDAIGGLFQEEMQDDADASALRQRAEERAFQKEFARMGIQWKVADAKDAGLHPLFALGGNTHSYTPLPVMTGGGGDGGTWSRMGQSLGNALHRQLDPGERELHKAQLRVLEAQAEKDFALASAARSEAMRSAGAAGASSSPVPTPFQPGWPDPGSELDVNAWARGVTQDPQLKYDAVRHKPDEVVSGRFDAPYASASKDRPALMEVRLPGGRRMLLPQSADIGESLEGMLNPLVMGAVLEANSEHYGPGWYRDMGKMFPGLKQLIEIGEDLGQVEWRNLKESVKKLLRGSRELKYDKKSGWIPQGGSQLPQTGWPSVHDLYRRY